MTQDEFTRELKHRGYNYHIKNSAVIITHDGDVYLDSLTELPSDTQFNNGDYVNLRSLTELPSDTQFNNGGGVNLPGLTELHPDTQFSNGGGVDLPRLKSEVQSYRGQSIRLRTVDGYTMLIENERTLSNGDVIMKTRYFGGGPIDELKRCWIASNGKYTAHGNSIAEAQRDLRFKIEQADYDADDLIAGCKERGEITFNEFRLLTGACLSGLKHGLESLGLSPDTEKLPLDEAMQLVRGQYGEARMKAAFGEAV